MGEVAIGILPKRSRYLFERMHCVQEASISHKAWETLGFTCVFYNSKAQRVSPGQTKERLSGTAREK
ncbi:hypothetical protein KTH_62610 [Thermosporothrix hazakensis]|jgi:hypothetical protein|nr:hypothetical protein KTH_62610 [Thermosporothrix hazakensis]